MPRYDYRCAANEQTVEVWHGINEGLATWGELCAQAEVDPGDTPVDAPVQRLISGGAIITGRKQEKTTPTAAARSCCARGGCGCM
jgi:hypothetical protein